MTGIQFVTDEKGRRVAVQIDLKRYGAVLEDFLGRADFGIAPPRKGDTAGTDQRGPCKTRAATMTSPSAFFLLSPRPEAHRFDSPPR